MATNEVWEQHIKSFVFIFDHNLDPTGSGNSSTILIVSLIASVMVDQVQKL